MRWGCEAGGELYSVCEKIVSSYPTTSANMMDGQGGLVSLGRYLGSHHPK